MPASCGANDSRSVEGRGESDERQRRPVPQAMGRGSRNRVRRGYRSIALGTARSWRNPPEHPNLRGQVTGPETEVNNQTSDNAVSLRVVPNVLDMRSLRRGAAVERSIFPAHTRSENSSNRPVRELHKTQPGNDLTLSASWGRWRVWKKTKSSIKIVKYREIP